MTTKWTAKDFTEHVKTLTNPFAKQGIVQATQKPKLSDVAVNLRKNGEKTLGV